MSTRINASDLTVIVDTTTTANTVNIGRTEKGNAEADPVWSISRILTTGGARVETVNGGEPDQIWTNRASLTYSI